MHEGRAHPAQEAAATSLEFVGAAVAASLLLAGAAAALGEAPGRELGGGVGRAIEAVVAAPTSPPTPRRWRDVREWRTGGGSVPVRVSRDEIRMVPVLDPIALWSTRWQRASDLPGGFRGRVDASACVACAALEWSHELAPGLSTESGKGGHAGMRGGVDAHARLAIASAQVDARVDHDLGGHGAGFAQGRVRATAGAEADASLEARVNANAVDVAVEGGAMAGAVARAEVKTGIDLLGISIRQGGRAEGWAGAGVRGTAGVRRERGIVSWRFGWGAAVGLGGAGEWSGSVDASKVPASHRRLARDALSGALTAAGFHIPLPR